MKKSFALRLAAVTAFTMAAVAPAFAAVDASITTALADMKADGLVVAGAVLVAIIAIAAFKILRKAV
jgi:ABC-type proline/glycine betaine transport system permease subunit